MRGLIFIIRDLFVCGGLNLVLIMFISVLLFVILGYVVVVIVCVVCEGVYGDEMKVICVVNWYLNWS